MDKLKQIIRQIKEYEDNNCFELKTSVVLHWLNEIQKEVINNTHSCETFYCQSHIEDGGKCDSQCDHCKEYYKPLEQ